MGLSVADTLLLSELQIAVRSGRYSFRGHGEIYSRRNIASGRRGDSVVRVEGVLQLQKARGFGTDEGNDSSSETKRMDIVMQLPLQLRLSFISSKGRHLRQ